MEATQAKGGGQNVGNTDRRRSADPTRRSAQVLSPIFEKDFSNHSYGFRPGRSAHDAVRAAQEYVKAGKGWVVDIDLKAFFDQVNHDKLMNLVGRKIRDKAILKLIGKYLRAPMQRAGKKEARDKGTPQGGPLSPLLANIYLDPLDKELEKRGMGFVRYADLFYRHLLPHAEPTLSRTHSGKRG